MKLRLACVCSLSLLVNKINVAGPLFVLLKVCVWMFCLHVHHMSAWCLQRPEEDTGPLELELQMLVAALWVLGTESGLNCRAISLASCVLSFPLSGYDKHL